MPKVVDYPTRRLELVQVTWRIIASKGLDGATMREIAKEAGFANGALKPYFSNKDELLTYAFQHVFDQTNKRASISTRGLKGLAALRAFCHEVLPLDDERRLEARIVIPFWQRALTDSAKSAMHEQSMTEWRNRLLGYLAESRELGELGTTIEDHHITSHLMSMTMGAQILAVVFVEEDSGQKQIRELDAYLDLLKAG